MNKSYYAIIPANVRYDEDLPPNAKLLYGEITALCNEKGYCWASNNYFAKLYKAKVETVSRWVSKLQKKKYITVHIDRSKGNERKIFLGSIDFNINTYCEKNQEVLTKKSIGIDEKINRVKSGTLDVSRDRGQKKSSNNTVNNTSNNKYIKSCKQDIPYSEIIDYLNIKVGTKYKATTKKTQTLIHARHEENFTLEDFKNVIDKKCNEWLGTEMEQYLRPQTLFGTKFESYLNQKGERRSGQAISNNTASKSKWGNVQIKQRKLSQQERAALECDDII